MRTIFCTHQNFCKRYETPKIPSTSFGGCKNFVRRENPLFLDIHPSLGHQILQQMDYEANVTVWLPASVLSLNILLVVINWLWQCVRRRINPVVYTNTLNDFPSWLPTSKNQPFFMNNRGFYTERYFSDKIHASLIEDYVAWRRQFP